MSKLNLSNYKSSGVYFIESDNSIIDVIENKSIRLVPGFSEHGPFNKPIILSKPADRKKIFGDSINTKLEKKGCFFERTLDILLEDGDPVIALNLLKTNEDDKVDYVGFHIGNDASSFFTDKDSSEYVYQEFFNRARFWEPSTENLIAINKKANSKAIVNMVNIGTTPISVFIVKEPIAGYNVSAKNWFNGENPYSWLKDTDFISDYFVKVVAIKGNWTNYNQYVNDITWKNYFDVNGLKTGMINDFIREDGVVLLGSWTGCLIPNFYNKAGNLVSIDALVNQNTTETGLMMAINESVLLDYDSDSDAMIDLVGHNIKNDASIKLLSYKEFNATSIDNVDPSICSFRRDSSDSTVVVIDEDASNKEYIKNIKVGDLFTTDNENENVHAKIVKVQKIKNDNATYTYKFTCNDVVATTPQYRKALTHDVLTHVELTYLKGLTLGAKHMPGYDASAFDFNKCANVYTMLNDEGIKRGLIDLDMISYRYIIDTMAGGIGDELKYKNILSNIAKTRGKCTAIINAPSITQLAMSSDPVFCDEFGANAISGVFNSDYVPAGGNAAIVSSDPLTLPSKANGADYCGVFAPFLKYRDKSRTLLIPPAAHVARAFNKKYAAGADSYMTVANRNGILDDSKVIGLEYIFDGKDRDNLEPFGINPIIKQDGNYMIYGDRTAYQEVISDLNYLHIRELLNTIEIECYDVLKGYVFQKNNELTRSEIVRKLTPILDEKVNAGALYSYSIKMDKENNTEDIINRSFAIIDIEVQCTKNMEKIVTQIKINKYTA